MRQLNPLRSSLHYLRLLVFGSLFLAAACNGSPNNPNSSRSNILAQSTKFKYYINVGNPRGYKAVYERRNSYFMDATGKPIIYFGGLIGSGGGWGNGSQATSLSTKDVMPAAVKVRWFSTSENQFWEGEFKLPQYELYLLIKNGYRNVLNGNDKDTYSDFTINVAPGGFVVLWLGGGAQKMQVGEFQAKKIEMDWEEFRKYSIEYQIGRKEFIDVSMNDLNSVSDKIRQEVKRGTLPTDSGPWKLLQRKYLWRLQLSSPFVLKDFRTWYANAESLYTYADKVDDYQTSAVPYQISFTFQKPDQKIDKIRLELDKEQMIEAYKKLGGAQFNKLDLTLNLSADMKKAAVYLSNKDEKIKLTIKKMYLAKLR